MPYHDLKCADGHLIDHVRHPTDVLPPCPHCGAETSISWHTGRAPGMNGFGAVTTDGGTMTTMEFEAHKREIEAANPGTRVKATYYSDNEIDQRIADRKQRIINTRKARGIDIDAVREERVEILEKKREAVCATLPSDIASKKVADINHKIARNKATLTY